MCDISTITPKLLDGVFLNVSALIWMWDEYEIDSIIPVPECYVAVETEVASNRNINSGRELGWTEPLLPKIPQRRNV